MAKDLRQMSEDELREELQRIRLRRRQGYDRGSKKKRSETQVIPDVSADVALKILQELDEMLKEGELNGNIKH